MQKLQLVTGEQPVAKPPHEAGEVIRTKKNGPLREHPLLKHELQSRSCVVRTLGRLGVDVETIKPIGRPPRAHGWLPDADNP